MSTVHVTVSDTGISLRTEGIQGSLTAPLPALPTGGDFWDDIACLALPPGTTPDGEAAKRLWQHLVDSGGHAPVAERLGKALFALLFSPPKLQDAYRSARDQGGTLRLILEFALDPEKPGSAAGRWAGLPWEYLFDPEAAVHLARRPHTHLVRRLSAGAAAVPVRAAAPLKVLALAAEPWGEQPYGREEAFRALTGEAGGGGLAIALCPHATLAGMVRALAEHEPHVLHVVAHGNFHPGSGGTLALENDYGGTDLVPADELRTVLGNSGLRLVVLCSCRSAAGEGVSGFQGVAQALLRGGVPAVVAMQYVTPVETAHRFTGELYRALARGTALDEAVALARRVLGASPALGPVDWAIPVLYMQSDHQWRLSRGRAPAVPATPQCPVAPSNLAAAPGRPLRLYGRSGEMIALARAMREPLQRRRFVTVAGLGGIGKTAAALESAFWHWERDCFPDGIFWVSAKDVPSHLQLLASLGSAVGIPDFEQAPVPAQEETLLALVARRKLLLVVDNADPLRESTEFLGFLERLDPSPAGCLLLTSRRRMGVDGESAVELDRLPLEAAVALFLHGWDTKAVPRAALEEVQAICGRGLLDGHPLAIVLASAVARKERLASLSSLRDRLRARMGDVLRDRKTREVEESLEASLALSYDALGEAARQVLARCSVFERPFRREAIEAVAGDVAGWREAPAALLDHHLMDRVHAETSDGQALDLFSMHPVVRAYGLGKAGDLKSLNLRAGKFLAGTKYLNENVEGVRRLEAAEVWEEVMELAKSIEGLLDRRGLWAEDEAVLQAALHAARALGRRQDEGDFLGTLGLNYRRLGEVKKAIGYHDQALAISREIGERRREGAALGYLGSAYYRLGEVRVAIGYYEQALAIAREIGDRRGEGSDLGNLGLAYYRLGEVAKAIAYHDQALAISREIGHRQAEGNHLGNLGNAYAAMGEVRKAIGYHEQALAIAREIGDRGGEGTRLGNLGNAYASLGEAIKAIGYYEQALAISREIGDRQGEGNHLGNLGNVCPRPGGSRQAIAYYGQALAVFRDIGDRRGEGNTLQNLGLLHSRQGDYEAALKCLLPAFAILRQIESPDAATVTRNIQEVREKLGEEAFKALLEKVARELGIQVALGDPGPAGGPPPGGPSP